MNTKVRLPKHCKKGFLFFLLFSHILKDLSLFIYVHVMTSPVTITKLTPKTGGNPTVPPLILHSFPLPMPSAATTKKRPQLPQPSPSQSQPKHHASSSHLEDEDIDEDVFLDETLILDDEHILRDIEDRRALASRLSKWARLPLSPAYLSSSQSISILSILCSSFNV